VDEWPEDDLMTGGIMGVGTVGQAFAKPLLSAGIDVFISNSHGPESLASVFYRGELGPTRAHLERGMALSDAQQHRAQAVLYGGMTLACAVGA
jgi:predicted dinucleotide-binding enzyme